MARSLSAFLAQNAKKVDNTKYVASDRFTDEDGNPVEWEIAGITASENQRLRNECTRKVPTGKRGQYTQDFDTALYQNKLLTRCVVFPDLNDKDLQDSYGVMSAEHLISTMLTPGEFDELFVFVTELNGFNTKGELVEEAKN